MCRGRGYVSTSTAGGGEYIIRACRDATREEKIALTKCHRACLKEVH